MGGLVCAIHAYAVLADAKPPLQPPDASDPIYINQCVGFDAKLRQVLGDDDVARALTDANLAMTVCPILEKPVWSAAERQALWTALQSLWHGIYGTNR